MMPRRDMTLFWRIVYHDGRELLLRRCGQILATGTNREVIALAELMTNRVEGLPTKKVETTRRREAVFVLTTVFPGKPTTPRLPMAARPERAPLATASWPRGR